MTRAMKDSGVEWIGEIPEDWKFVRNKNVFTNNKELVGAKSEETQLLSLTTRGIREKDINSTFGKLPETFDTYQIVKKNDLVMCLFDLDMSAVFSGISNFDGMISPAYKVLKTKNGYVPQFADYWFKYIFDGRKFEHYAKNIRSTLTFDEFSVLPIVFPSFEEQNKITFFLNAKVNHIDTIVEKSTQSIEALKQYKQALITETVTKGLNPDVKMKDSGIEWIGEIPEHWDVSRLRYLGTLQNGISKSGDSFGSGFPFLSYGDVYRDIELPKTASGLIESSESDRLNYSVTYGDVLFTRTSETIEEVGFSSTCLETIPEVVFTGFVIRFRPMTDELFPRFSKYYFRSQIHRSFFTKEMNLVTRASLSQPLLKKLPVLLPSIEEQQQIADFLDDKTAHIDALIADKEKMVQELQEYKKSLIYEYVTGKKEV